MISIAEMDETGSIFTILLADDHGLYRESIKHWLESADTNYHIETASSYGEVVDFLASGNAPKLIMLDLCMPGMNGVESARDLHVKWPNIPILVVSANENPETMRGCIEAGASGFIPKSSNGEDILDAIRRTLSGKAVIPSGVMSLEVPHFSGKKLKVLHLLAEELSNRKIATLAHLSEGTVKQYVSDILSRLDVDNRVQAGIRAREILGLMS